MTDKSNRQFSIFFAISLLVAALGLIAVAAAVHAFTPPVRAAQTIAPWPPSDWAAIEAQAYLPLGKAGELRVVLLKILDCDYVVVESRVETGATEMQARQQVVPMHSPTCRNPAHK